MRKILLLVLGAIVIFLGVQFYFSSQGARSTVQPVIVNDRIPEDWNESDKENESPTNSASDQDAVVDVATPPSDGGAAGFARLSENAIYVAEQRPGNEVVVHLVNIAPKGFVVIHEYQDGKIGAVLGSAPLEAKSETKNVPVPLSRTVADGEELIAVLHEEKAGAGFSEATDAPVLDPLGSPLSMSFIVSKDAPNPEDVQVVF